MRAPHLSPTATHPTTRKYGAYPSRKIGRQNRTRRLKQNASASRALVKVFKVPTMMSCGQGGAKPLASESRLLQARLGDAAMRAQVQVQARTGGADGGSCGGGGMHGCTARKRSAWGSVAGHMCALQQGWVLRARRGDAPERQPEEVAAGRCVTSGMSTLA